MATYYKNTIDVQVFTEGAPTETQSFSNPLLMVPHNLTSNTIDTFTDTSSVESAGAAVNSPLYTMVQGSKAGIAPPDLVKVGRLEVDTITLTINSLPEVDEDVSVNTTVNGVSTIVSATVASDDTTTEMATKLAAALASEYTTDTDNPTFSESTNTIVITPQTYAASFGWRSANGTTPHVTVTTQTSEAYSTAIGDAIQEDSDVSFIFIESKLPVDILEVAAYTEGLELQQFLTSTSDADVKDSSSTSNLALDLQGLAYDKTYMQYHPLAENYFPETAWMSNFAKLDPWTLYNPSGLVAMSGVPSIKITPQEAITLASSNVAWNKLERGQQYLNKAWASSGMFLDYQRFALWLKYSLETSLFALKRKKEQLGKTIPYDDEGARMMENQVTKDTVNVGIRGGRIATGTSRDDFGNVINLNPIVDFSTRANQTDVNIANRIWDEGFVEVVMLSGIDQIKVKAYALTNRQFEV